MDPAPHASPAGQATIEYVAVITLVALLLAFAAPAVGGPDIPRALQRKIRLGICVVGGDICSPKDARAAGVSPCTLSARTDGMSLGVSVLSIDIGGNGTLTLSPQSDGTVLAGLSSGVSGGVSAGLGLDLDLGPVRLNAGPSGSLGVKVQDAKGWTFPNAAAAQRFVDGLPGSLARKPSWRSVEAGQDLSAALSVGAGAPVKGAPGGLDHYLGALGISGATGDVLGGRFATDGTVTLYARAAYEVPEAVLPFMASIGPGPHTTSLEYSFKHGEPQQLAIRSAQPSQAGNRMTDTVLRLDLRDPANLAVARRILAARSSADWTTAWNAVRDRIRAVGIVEQSLSSYNDATSGISGGIKLGLHFGAYAKRVKIRKSLLSATAWTAGSGPRDRYDCTVANGGG